MKTTKLNAAQQEYCRIHKISENQFFGKTLIRKCLTNTMDIPAGFCPKIKGHFIDTDSTNEYPKNFHVECQGRFYSAIFKLPANFSVVADKGITINSVSAGNGLDLNCKSGNMTLPILQQLPKEHKLEGESISLGSCSRLPGKLNIVGTCCSLYLPALNKTPKNFSVDVDYLHLPAVMETAPGFCPKVSRQLAMPALKKVGKGFSPFVGGTFSCGIRKVTKNFRPVCQHRLRLINAKTVCADFDLKVRDFLEFSSYVKVGKNFRPVVGDGLRFRKGAEFAKGFDPIVGGEFSADGKTIFPKDCNLVVGGRVLLSDDGRNVFPSGARIRSARWVIIRNLTTSPELLQKKYHELTTLPGIEVEDIGTPNLIINTTNCDELFDRRGVEWQGGKYIMRDGILSEVVANRGNVYRVKGVNSDKLRYLITDGYGRWAHGDTLKEAKESLMYKLVNRDTSAYANLKLNDVLGLKEAISCYRAITGACESGVRGFVETKLKGEPKKQYTLAQIIELTSGRYGSKEFKEFFEKKKPTKNIKNNYDEDHQRNKGDKDKR